MPEFSRRLSLFSLVGLGMGSTVGTGILFSTAGMAAAAGPSVVLAWAFGAVLFGFISIMFVELGLQYPEAGGPARYGFYSHGQGVSLIQGLCDLTWYVLIPPIEALAALEGINYYYPHFVDANGNPTVLGAGLAAVLLLIFLPFNYFGVEGLRRYNNVFASVKIVLYVAAAIGFVVFARTANFTDYGGFFPLGGSGLLQAIPLGMFAFGGIRIICDYSEEIRKTGHLRSAIILTLVGQALLYILFSIAFVLSLNWQAVSLRPGAWPDIETISGNPFLVIAGHSGMTWLVPLTVLMAIVGPFVSGYIYQGGASRVVVAMSRSGLLSRRLGELNERFRVPSRALIAVTVLGAILAFLTAPEPKIYGLINDAVSAGYLGYSANPVCLLAQRAEGRPAVTLIGRSRVLCVLAFAASSLIVYWSGWPSVPYAAIIIAVLGITLAIVYKARNLRNCLWYVGHGLFLTLMAYVGGVGGATLVPESLGTIIVVVVSTAVILPWGVASRAPQPKHIPAQSTALAGEA